MKSGFCDRWLRALGTVFRRIELFFLTFWLTSRTWFGQLERGDFGNVAEQGRSEIDDGRIQWKQREKSSLEYLIKF